MSDEKKPAVVADQKAVKPPAIEQFDMTLDEFCQRASSEPGASPEMISGFHSEQKATGVIKKTATDFVAAFASFAKQPA